MKTQEDKTAATKPPYKIPSMAEIEALPKNGYDVVSTFSGCGGSCLGYRMAGFNVAWANEFIPAAQDTYVANHPSTILDKRDIRKIQPKEILDILGKNAGEIDLLDGSPPCAAFSTAGKRSDGWGTVKSYSDSKQRVDDLFFEYSRILEGLQPKTFIAENVSGLVKGVAKGYFKEILKRLQDCGYRVSARVLDAKWLGVPQSRQRLIVGRDVFHDPGSGEVVPQEDDFLIQHHVRVSLQGVPRDACHLGVRLAWWRTPYKIEVREVVQQVGVGIPDDHGVLRVQSLVDCRDSWVHFHGGHFHILPVLAVSAQAREQVQHPERMNKCLTPTGRAAFFRRFHGD